LYVKQDAVEPPALPAQLQLRVFGLLTVELYVPAEQAAPADGNESETVPLALPQTPLRPVGLPEEEPVVHYYDDDDDYYGYSDDSEDFDDDDDPFDEPVNYGRGYYNRQPRYQWYMR
jgi:hypothetical protein